MITEKNKPNEILIVVPDKCFIFNIISAENRVIRTNKIGSVINFNNWRSTSIIE